MYRVTNISDGQIVCTLASGDTLRLDVRKNKTIQDTDMTDYLEHIESVGRIKCTHIADEDGSETRQSLATASVSKKSGKKVAQVDNEKED